MPRPLTLPLLTLALACGPAAAAAPAPAPTDAAAAPADDAEHRRYGDWHASRIGGGGFILGTRFTSDPDRVYAWTDVGGAHRSLDGGRTWRNMTYTLPYGGDTASRGMMYCRDLLTDPNDPDRVLIAIGYPWSPQYGLYRTDDAGESWTRVHEGWYISDYSSRWRGSVMDRAPSERSTIYTAMIRDGVAVSRDNGETWEELGGPSTEPADILVDARDPQRVWVAGVGATNPAGEELANTHGDQLVLPGGLWRSDDGGKNWTALLEDETVTNLAQDPDDPDRLFAIRRGATEVAVSTDDGETWTPVMDGLNPRFEGDGDQSNNASTYGNFSEDTADLYLAAMRDDVFRLRQSGDGWERVGPERIIEPEDWWGSTKERPTYGTDWVNSFSAIASIEQSPHDPEELVATDWYSVYRSFDAGKTWTNMTEGIEETYVDALEQDPSDPDVVHLGVADIGYFRSDNGGRSFLGISATTPITNNIKSISVPASDTSRVYAIGPVPPGGGWYAGVPFVSDDRGSSWEASPMTGLPKIGEGEGDLRGHTILAVDDAPDTVYLALAGPVGPQAGGLYRSTDAGESWAKDDAGLPEGFEFFRWASWGGGKEVAIGRSGTVLVNSIEHGRLFRRPAGADRFEEVEFPAASGFNDVRADATRPAGEPTRFYATGPYAGFFRSDDDGRTWTRSEVPDATPHPKQLIVDRVVPGRVAVGTSNGLALSRDHGKTWEVLDQRLPGRVDWNKGAFAGDHLVVGSGGTGCYWIDVSD